MSIIKDGAFSAENYGDGPDDDVELQAVIDQKLRLGRLAGFSRKARFPRATSAASERTTSSSVRSSADCRSCASRGAAEAFAVRSPYLIAGSNLTAIKARLLLMAALMKLGNLPIARDPVRPSDAEREATRKAISAY